MKKCLCFIPFSLALKNCRRQFVIFIGLVLEKQYFLSSNAFFDAFSESVSLIARDATMEIESLATKLPTYFNLF